MLDDGDWFRKIWEPLSKKWIRIHFFIQRHPRLISIFRGCPKTKKRILNNIWSISLIHCSWVYCSWFWQQDFLTRKKGYCIYDATSSVIFHLTECLNMFFKNSFAFLYASYKNNQTSFSTHIHSKPHPRPTPRGWN